jgi:hypothetical protein
MSTTAHCVPSGSKRGSVAKLVGGALLCSGLAHAAHAQDAGAPTSVGLVASPGSDHRLGLSITQRPVARWPAPATETMLWAGHGPVAAGLGWLQAPQALDGNPLPAWARGAAAANEAALLVGLAVTPNDRTRLTWQTALTHASPDLNPAAASSMRLGLAFKVRDPLAELRRGALMELEFSAQTQLTLRPSSGHLNLSLHSRW